MPFLIEATDSDGQAAVRQRLRPQHLDYLAGNAQLLLAAGAKLSDDGGTPLGSFYLIDVEDQSAARAFIEADPYAKSGVFGDVRLIRVRKGFFNHARVVQVA